MPLAGEGLGATGLLITVLAADPQVPSFPAGGTFGSSGQEQCVGPQGSAFGGLGGTCPWGLGSGPGRY